MLSKLHIRNFAIIDKIDIEFSKGLHVITGETGAGKSILMGALNLVLGERAESISLAGSNGKCIVEATFEIKGKEEVNNFILRNDLDPGSQVVLRREIAPGGKSRSFINDSPVNLSQLKVLASFLVDLHQQFDTLALSKDNFQLEIIDAIAGNGSILSELRITFDQYAEVSKKLADAKAAQLNASKEFDYIHYQLDELNQLALQENELEQLDNELKLLSNSEGIKQQLTQFNNELKEGERPILQQLKSILNKFSGLRDFHPSIQQLEKRLTSQVIELQDIADEIESLDESIVFDPERIQIINERLSIGYRLLKKHGVRQTSELLEIQEQLVLKLDKVEHISDSIEQLEKEESVLFENCLRLSQILSKNRTGHLASFGDKVNKLLVQVGMPNAKLKVVRSEASLGRTGIDDIRFLFNANIPQEKIGGEGYLPLGKIASGGELSRLMLCIKSLVAGSLQLPTLIFDEIDSGISGEAAKQVGMIMKKLSVNHQVISITHQPQIAAKGDIHYFVYKEKVEGRIITRIRILKEEERIESIAKMLAGAKPTEAALANAREMVG